MAGQEVDASFPFEIKEADEETAQKYPDVAENFIFVGPQKYCYIKVFKEMLPKLYHFETRPDDVWLLGCRRSGTTLTSEIVWLLCNNLDYQKANETILNLRFPLLESTVCKRDNLKNLVNLKSCQGRSEEICEKMSKLTLETLSESQKKRLIKTHLPLSLAPSNILTSGCKVIYVARNPKDVCVSQYLLSTSYNTVGPCKTFEEFWDHFHQGLVLFTPYPDHVKKGWEVKDNKNVLFLFYENLCKDTKGTIRILADFLEKEISESDVETLVEHVKIENFRKNKSVNNDYWRDVGIFKDKADSFIRKGEIGGYRDYIQGHIEIEFDTWINENFKDSDYLETFS